MPPILSFLGTKLLEQPVIAEIKKQADLLLRDKDVALAWLSAGHIKTELSQLDACSLASALPEYRAITARLKALALPLLEKDEVAGLLQNNLLYIDDKVDDVFLSGLSAWLVCQPESEQAQSADELASRIPPDSPLAQKIRQALGLSASSADKPSEEQGHIPQQRSVPAPDASGGAVAIADKDKVFEPYAAR